MSGSTTTVASYIGGGIEEAQSVNGGAVTLTKYLGAPGMPGMPQAADTAHRGRD